MKIQCKEILSWHCPAHRRLKVATVKTFANHSAFHAVPTDAWMGPFYELLLFFLVDLLVCLLFVECTMSLRQWSNSISPQKAACALNQTVTVFDRSGAHCSLLICSFANCYFALWTGEAFHAHSTLTHTAAGVGCWSCDETSCRFLFTSNSQLLLPLPTGNMHNYLKSKLLESDCIFRGVIYLTFFVILKYFCQTNV